MASLKKYIISFKNSIQQGLTYRASFYSGFFILLVPFFIKISIWKGAFLSSGQDYIQSYSFNDLLLYNALVMVLGYLNQVFFHYEISFEIKNGELSKYLTKPLNYTKYWLSKMLGKKMIELIYSTLFFGVVFILFLSRFLKISILYYFFSIFVIALGVILNFYIYYCISLLTFWFTEVFSLFTAFNFIITFLNGEIIPIDMLPTGFRAIVDVLPFCYAVYFPAQILTTNISIAVIFQKMLYQCLWILLLHIISNFMWKHGIKRYDSIGG